MKNGFFYWFIILILAILLSSFLHEVGHGLSAYIKGYPVSTGFNKVGDYNKKPDDHDFREEHEKYSNPWDVSIENKITGMFSYSWSFTVISAGAFIAAMRIIRVLDKYLRINWGGGVICHRLLSAWRQTQWIKKIV